MKSSNDKVAIPPSLVAGRDYPRTYREFVEMFPDDEACAAYLEQLRWPNGFFCPACQMTTEPWHQPRGRLVCPSCRHQTSVIAGTILDKTRTPLTTWFEAGWYLPMAGVVTTICINMDTHARKPCCRHRGIPPMSPCQAYTEYRACSNDGFWGLIKDQSFPLTYSPIWRSLAFGLIDAHLAAAGYSFADPWNRLPLPGLLSKPTSPMATNGLDFSK